jgi:hypothetical protein
VTPEQSIEGGRLLGWSQLRLALSADLSPFAVELFEAGNPSTAAVILSIQAALEAAGVEFIADSGSGARVRLRKIDKRPPD